MGEHTPDAIGAKVADRLFASRKGHGGAPVSYLQLRKDDLAGIIAESIKLSDAHSRATIDALVGALEACEEYFDNRSDVKDGDYGIPEPNREMVLLSEVRAALLASKEGHHA